MRSTSYNDSAQQHEEETGWGLAFVGIIVALILAYGVYAYFASNQAEPIDYSSGTVAYNNDADEPAPETNQVR